MIVSGEEVARFVSERLGFGLYPPYCAIGTERDGAIVNGVLLNCFQRHSVHVTAAGTGWGRDFLQALGAYVFGDLGCLRATITTENEEVARLAERLGGKREGVLRDQFGEGRDGIVIGVLRRNYRYASFGPE